MENCAVTVEPSDRETPPRLRVLRSAPVADCLSWGRYPRALHFARQIETRHDCFPADESCVLPYGLGRSYGDSCLNDGATILRTARLDNLIHFDREHGIVRAEAGVSLDQLLHVIVPAGWFLPVTPGTTFVTLGGAVANDVHGKNHHRAGTFGCHVRAFELLRSSGERLFCTPLQNDGLYRATICGLGLTGLITWVEIQLVPIGSSYIAEEAIRCENLDRFFEISAQSDRDFDYTVAWIDCLAGGRGFGRGIFLRGNHIAAQDAAAQRLPALAREQRHRPRLSVPFDFPSWVLNRATLTLFNELYYRKQYRSVLHRAVHYRPFFYPLDSVAHWNRIYGKRGMMQFQCVVSGTDRRERIRQMLRIIVDSGQASFLAVLKEFGSPESPGMLSFPRQGMTLSLDFANRGDSTMRLLKRLDDVVAESNGRIYPAKDSIMSAEHFAKYYPRLDEFRPFLDPKFSSSFWRRVSDEPVRNPGQISAVG